MSPSAPSLAAEIIRLVEINRTTINGLAYGEVIFKIHRGRLVAVAASETMQLSVGVQLSPLSLKSEKSE